MQRKLLENEIREVLNPSGSHPAAESVRASRDGYPDAPQDVRDIQYRVQAELHRLGPWSGINGDYSEISTELLREFPPRRMHNDY